MDKLGVLRGGRRIGGRIGGKGGKGKGEGEGGEGGRGRRSRRGGGGGKTEGERSLQAAGLQPLRRCYSLARKRFRALATTHRLGWPHPRTTIKYKRGDIPMGLYGLGEDRACRGIYVEPRSRSHIVIHMTAIVRNLAEYLHHSQAVREIEISSLVLLLADSYY